MSRRSSLFAGAILLIAIVAGLYAPVYQADFVDYDDFDYVYGNPHVASGLSVANVKWAFTTPHSSNWHPLTWISHMVDVELFGVDGSGRPYPHGHHVTNTGLHAINAVLLFLMLTSITGQLAPSFVVAALFAVHPVNVESVAWIAQRKSTLSTLFAIVTIWSYCLYARTGNRKQYAASLGCFALSLMAKQTMVTMPFALLLLDYWPLACKELEPPRGQKTTVRTLLTGWWRLFPEKLPYLAAVVLASVITLIVQQQAMQTVERYPLAARLGNIAISYVGYLVSLVWPIHLAVYYPLEPQTITPGKVIGSLAIIAALSGVLCWLGLRWRYLLTGWLWFLGTMVPMIGLVHVGSQSMADRYAYIPFWGLWIALVWSARDMLAWLGRRAAPRAAGMLAVTIAPVLVVLVALGWLTFVQASKWTDTKTLFADALADTPSNWLAHRQLATQYMAEGDYQAALHHCEELIKSQRERGQSLAIYGLALHYTGAQELAVQTLQEAIKVAPDNSLAHTNLGLVYAEQGQDTEADQMFSLAAQDLKSSDTPYAHRLVYANWGKVLAKLGRWADASEKYDLALATGTNPGFLRDAAQIELHLNNPDGAIKRLSKAIEIDRAANPAAPADRQQQAKSLAASCMALGEIRRLQGNLPEAVVQYERAVQVYPHADTVLELTKLLPRVGRTADATKLLGSLLSAAEQQVARHPDDPQAKVSCSQVHTQLGDLALAQKNAAEAIEQYDRALAAWSDNLAANNNLAWLLATQPDAKCRDSKRAVQLAEHARKLSKLPDYATLSTLAAAYAANHSLPEAVRAAREALDLAVKQGDKSAAEACRRQLQLYEQGKPYIEP